jgi:hypothetical protein
MKNLKQLSLGLLSLIPSVLVGIFLIHYVITNPLYHQIMYIIFNIICAGIGLIMILSLLFVVFLVTRAGLLTLLKTIKVKVPKDGDNSRKS